VGRPRVEIDLGAPGAARHAADLARGGLFIAGEELALDGECDIEVLGGTAPIVILARVVFSDGNGIGVELMIDAEIRATLIALAESAPGEDETVQDDDTAQDDGGLDLPPEPAFELSDDLTLDAETADADTADAATLDAETANPDDDDDEPGSGDPVARNVFERLRGLTLVQQYKVARAGEMHERVALERIYGKTVWEQLLRNPRITPHEVARIARMGNLPRPQLEIIVGNATWLGVPEVRRALLSNTRLGVEVIPRILRHLPRHELKLVPTQIAYPAAVREAARRMLRTAIP
jgi:hypothetical protein